MSSNYMTAQQVRQRGKWASNSCSSKRQYQSRTRCLNNPRTGAQVPHAAPVTKTAILASIVFDSGTEKHKLDSG